MCGDLAFRRLDLGLDQARAEVGGVEIVSTFFLLDYIIVLNGL